MAGPVYLATGEEAALLAASLQYVIILQQLLPLLRFDGYYVLSDLTGVPDILSRVKPIFRSLLRPRTPEPQVAELKPWVRAVVTIYVIVLVPELTMLLVSMVMGAPRMLATTYDSLGLQLDRIRSASGPAEMGLGGFQIIALVMPVAAMSVSLGRTARRAGRGVHNWANGSRQRTAAALTGVLAVLAATTYVLLPNGDYEPIRPGERGTIGEAVESLPATTSGRPAFTPTHATEFAPVPTERAPVDSRRAPAQRQSEQGTTGGRQEREIRRKKPASGRDAPVAPGVQDRPASVTPTPAGGSTPSAPARSEGTPTPTTTPTPTATATPTASPEATATPTPAETAAATP